MGRLRQPTYTPHEIVRKSHATNDPEPTDHTPMTRGFGDLKKFSSNLVQSAHQVATAQAQRGTAAFVLFSFFAQVFILDLFVMKNETSSRKDFPRNLTQHAVLLFRASAVCRNAYHDQTDSTAQYHHQNDEKQNLSDTWASASAAAVDDDRVAVRLRYSIDYLENLSGAMRFSLTYVWPAKVVILSDVSRLVGKLQKTKMTSERLASKLLGRLAVLNDNL